MSRGLKWAAAATLLTATAAAAQTGPRYDLGRKATEAEIAGWNIDVEPDGTGLPAGSGDVSDGKKLYAAQCQSCHGAGGKGGPMNDLVGGIGTLADAKPVRTVGSYWPYASTLYDYINRAMPYTAPHSLEPDQVYAVTAYILHLNGLVAADATLDAASLPRVEMPNRNGFVSPDPRPDTHNTACMDDCRPKD